MITSPERRFVVVMVKEPRAGRVKTRLARGIGTTVAAWWYRHQTAKTLRILRDPRWQLILAVSPDRTGIHGRAWPGDLPRIPQGEGDLGDRMGRVLRCLPPGPVLIVGSDIPDLNRTHIARAFERLRGHDAVLGPAADGGYWLVGLRRGPIPRRLFAGVRWSTEHALEDTTSSMDGLRIARADTLQDVDTAADLAR